MTTEHPGDDREHAGHSGDEQEHMAEVVPLRAENAETGLDQARGAAYLDTSGTGEARRHPVIPEHLRRDRIRQTAAEVLGLHWYKARYHGFRSPAYAAKTAWYAIRGLFRLGGQLLAWANWADGWALESLAVAAGRPGHHDAMNAHTQGRKTRATRWQIIGVSAVAALAVLLAMARWLPWWGWVVAVVSAVVVLSRHGAPEGQRIIRAAVVPTAYQPPTPEVITRALGALGIAAINAVIKDGPGIAFVSDVARDGDGWGADIDLPYGVTAKDIIKRREALASGLRRPLTATWPEPVPHEHEGRLYLWVGRHDLSKVKPPPYPLLKTGQTDIFAHVPFATVPRGLGVTVPLFEANWLIGAAPGEGKTATVRDLACGAALDPVCDLWVHELAGKGDLGAFEQVAYRYCSGLDDEAIAYAAKSAALLRKELEKRQTIFKKIPRERRPHGKLTRELATADRRLRPILAIFDEVQNVYMHPEYGAAFAADMAYTGRLGRAYGIMLVQATQRPDKGSLPTAISGIITARFCLKVPDQVGNDMILGTGAYSAGFNAVTFRHEIDAGLGWLRGTGDPQAVRTYYLDLNDTAKICARARAMRQAAGVLSGYALGEASTEEARSFAADVVTVFAGANALWCETIAARLREHLPEVYADITKEAVASQLRGLEIDVRDVREPGQGPRKGCYRAAVEAVAGGRETGDA